MKEDRSLHLPAGGGGGGGGEACGGRHAGTDETRGGSGLRGRSMIRAEGRRAGGGRVQGGMISGSPGSRLI